MLMRINYMGGKAKKNQAKPLAERSKLNANRIEAVKQHIQLSKLVNRVQDYVLSNPNSEDWEAVKMEPSQLNGAKLLIERLLPTTRHETIEQTVNNTYSISSQVSDKIASLLIQAKEKAVKGQVIENKTCIETTQNYTDCNKPDKTIGNPYQDGESDKQMLSINEDMRENGTYASQFLANISDSSK